MSKIRSKYVILLFGCCSNFVRVGRSQKRKWRDPPKAPQRLVSMKREATFFSDVAGARPNIESAAAEGDMNG